MDPTSLSINWTNLWSPFQLEIKKRDLRNILSNGLRLIDWTVGRRTRLCKQLSTVIIEITH